tara:strand:- start:2728 stop:4242 length:1515 start_codon:yes stop_codon:yes gene_type:complete
MSLGSGKLGFFKNTQRGVGGTGIPDTGIMNIDVALSGNTTHANSNTFSNSFETPDANTITYSITGIVTNTTVKYEFTGVTGSDFTNTTISGNITTDANGNASITKTVTSSGGHKTVDFKLIHPTNNTTLVEASTVNLYEVTPITITGGDTTVTSQIMSESISDDGALSNSDINKGYLISNKQHHFTTGGNSNITISNYGNYSGNTNVWLNQYMVNASATGNAFATGQDNYWDQGLYYKVAITGAGGHTYSSGGGAGAGELGYLRYPLANVATGTYDIQIGTRSASGNSTIFKGNATLSRTAIGGGDGDNDPSTLGGGFAGGCGGGGSNGTPGVAQISNAETDLAQLASNVAFPGNMKEHVVWASGNDGIGTSGGSVLAGASNVSPYGTTNLIGNGSQSKLYGMIFTGDFNDKFTSDYNTLQTTDFRFFHANSPFVTGNKNFTQGIGKGSLKQGNSISGTLTLDPGDGFSNAFGFVTGGDGQDGGVFITYPYRAAYRFVTLTDLS